MSVGSQNFVQIGRLEESFPKKASFCISNGVFPNSNCIENAATVLTAAY